jgi:molybdopterin-containing oxidoreductase family membrane subunit
MRWIFKLENYIWEDHFDAVGRLLIVIATGWLFFFFLDFAFAFYSREEQELAVMERRLFQWPFNAIAFVMIMTSYVIPIPLWLNRRVRRNIPLMFWTSILVNIGMWLERFYLIIPAIERKQELTFLWSNYVPSLVESTIVLASFGMVAMLLIIFAKFAPLVPLWEQKESQVFRAEVQIGDATVQAVIKESEELRAW